MLALVKENGFHGTPMSMVARHAGVAAGTIYHYFESKEKLICELFGYIRKQMIAAVAKGDAEPLSYKDRFYSIWMNLYRFYEANPDMLWYIEQFVNSPYNTRKPEAGPDAFHSQLFSFFSRGVTEGYLKDMNPEILGILAHVNIIMTAKMQGKGQVVISDPELQQIAQLLWDGMCRHPGTS
ncbi:TetR/AcrR family transcriptional regulator [Pontibacter liquoris]|uniref:TetR/AcrR family transcriptional regulator n=1 Tax=Pontibacter liquoris TaxID=2905677 RepID=UPI001FA78576|nr:TetR/AcrR family transcriptional regulator [Pontibacter liquoris]